MAFDHDTVVILTCSSYMLNYLHVSVIEDVLIRCNLTLLRNRYITDLKSSDTPTGA